MNGYDDNHGWRRLPIRYDAAYGEFVGNGVDTFYFRQPGYIAERPRPAIAAVAEVIATMIDEQASRRRKR